MSLTSKSNKFAFFLELTFVPLLVGRSAKKFSVWIFISLVCGAFLFAMLASWTTIQLQSPGERATDVVASYLQNEYMASETNLPFTEESASNFVGLSLNFLALALVGCCFFSISLLLENLYYILLPLAPFSFLERVFRVNLAALAIPLAALLFAWLHLAWGFSFWHVFKLLPAALIFSFTLFEFGLLRSALVHIGYDFLIISFQLLEVWI